jgi:hypothetical protein
VSQPTYTSKGAMPKAGDVFDASFPARRLPSARPTDARAGRAGGRRQPDALFKLTIV